MMFLLSILFSFLTLYFEIQNKRHLAVFFLVNLTMGFGFFNLRSGLIEPAHIQFFTIIVLILISYNRNKRLFSIKGDPIALSVLILSMYFFLHLLMSILFHVDTVKNCLNSAFNNIIWLVFFYFRDVGFTPLKKCFRLIVLLNILQGFFYCLQYVGIYGVLNGGDEEVRGVIGGLRFYNLPFWTHLIIIYLFVSKDNEIKYRKALLFFFIGLLILAQGRGAILSLTVVALVYMFFINRQKKNLIFLASFYILYQFIVAPMFQAREADSNISTVEELSNVIKDPLKSYETFSYNEGEGTFSFRIAMLIERFMYMVDHPHYLPFGVGDVYENSENNKFIFMLGTNNMSAKYGKTMLSSVDIDWVEPLIKYGLLGVLLYILVYHSWAKRSYLCVFRPKSQGIVLMSALYCCYAFISSFNMSLLHRRLYIALFCMSIISISLKNNEQNNQMPKSL